MKISNNSFITVNDKAIRDNKATEDKDKVIKSEAKSSAVGDGIDSFTKTSVAPPVKQMKDYDESNYDGASANEKLADVKSTAQSDYESLFMAHDNVDAQKVISLLA